MFIDLLGIIICKLISCTIKPVYIIPVIIKAFFLQFPNLHAYRGGISLEINSNYILFL